MLDPADFGTVALASVFIVFILVIVESGFAEAIIQQRDVTPTDLNTAFVLNAVMGVAIALILIAVAQLIAEPLGQPQLAPVLQVLAAVPVLASLGKVPEAILRRGLAFRTIAVRGLLATLAGGVVGIAMAVGGAGVWSLVGQMVATAAAGTVLLWAMCSWRPGRTLSLKSFQELLRFSGKIVGGRLAQFGTQRSDDFLIGSVLGSVALGLYTVAYRIILILTETLIWTLESVAFPLLSRLQNDDKRRRRAFFAVTGLCFTVAVPAFLALAVLAPEVITVAFGQRWSGAIPVMQILALVGIPHAIVYSTRAAVNAGGRPDLTLRIAIATCVVNVVGFAVVVRWGIVAVAISYAVCSYLLLPVSVWSAVKVLALDVGSYLRLLVAPLISGIVMVLAVLGVKAVLPTEVTEPVRLALLLAVAVMAYAGVLCLTAWRQVKGYVAQARI
jgi:O-antigen/teichoic acid export membrane protein